MITKYKEFIFFKYSEIIGIWKSKISKIGNTLNFSQSTFYDIIKAYKNFD